jgi:fructoselysine-6-phosphate deglycase
MLNFNEPRFLDIQGGAAALGPDIRATIARLVADGAKNLFFAGSGGAGILMLPAIDLLQTRSSFPVYLEMPAQLVLRGNANLGANSIVVIPSLSGTTPESIEALEFSLGKGATVITLTGHADSPLAQAATINFTTFAEDDTSSETFYLQSLYIALAVLDARGELDDADAVFSELATLPAALLDVKSAFEPRASEFAQHIQNDGYHIITGAGSAWAEAFYYGMCILEEMQWIRTRPVHASDFFHGTLELVEDDVSVILFKGEDELRPLADRVAAFVPRFSERLWVLDTKDFALAGISDRVRSLISPIILATALERVSAHLEVLRDHPLTTRRYYKQMAY